ncbi:MAG: iron-containing alcohol dehydrogenase [Verrucomicrobia bacterium]|nr:iron-containing alcohol dehydrogenase [Verrucomicrobiota bacterium]
MTPLSAFDKTPRTRMVFGNGALVRLGELAREHGARAMLVTDAGIVKAGHAERALNSLRSAGLQVELFDRVHENPSTQDVADCVAVGREFQADLLIGLGGGSSMDTAKGCNFILTNGGEMKDYWGVGKATKPMLPLIAIPTTAGTGSECQSFALISDEKTHAKMACGDSKAAAKIALLDPELTISMPHRVTVLTGIDAIAHAIETAVTKKRNAISTVYSRESFRLLIGGFERVLRDPNDLEARGYMLLGAAFAGTAIENSMLGAAHSCANPLTAQFGIVHGHAVGLMRPHVIRFNSALVEPALEYRNLYDGDLADRVSVLLAEARLPGKLADLGVTINDISSLAAEAATQWTAKFNPREVTTTDFAMLYEAAM